MRKMEIKVDAGQIRGSDLLELKKTDLMHIGLSGCVNITDACIYIEYGKRTVNIHARTDVFIYPPPV